MNRARGNDGRNEHRRARSQQQHIPAAGDEGAHECICHSRCAAVRIPEERDETRIIGRQLLRSGTSVAANYRAVCRARSKPEFLSKMSIVIEEADETLFWLELLVSSGLVSQARLSALIQEASELVSIFVASRKTAKSAPLISITQSLNHPITQLLTPATDTFPRSCPHGSSRLR
ncbi:MAG: four helix bundle protein [Terriglobales bacterium]